MKIAIIGYGKMGHAVEAMAVERGRSVVCTIDNPQEMSEKQALLRSTDVAIEFTTPATAVGNIRGCFEAGVPVVCGTTGWLDAYDAVADECRTCGGAMLTASNFSIGMNIMFALNERLAELMRGRDDYRVTLSETHHIHKLDAPSGTAIVLRQAIRERLPQQEAPIESFRVGEVPGTHIVRYDSEIDTITLTHEAHSRRGLAQGALLAAEWLCGRKGVFTMKDLLDNAS